MAEKELNIIISCNWMKMNTFQDFVLEITLVWKRISQEIRRKRNTTCLTIQEYFLQESVINTSSELFLPVGDKKYLMKYKLLHRKLSEFIE